MINDLINGAGLSFCLSCGRLLYLTEPEVANTRGVPPPRDGVCTARPHHARGELRANRRHLRSHRRSATNPSRCIGLSAAIDLAADPSPRSHTG